MSLLEKFNEQEWSKKLDKRQLTFAEMMKHIEHFWNKNQAITILETGCIRTLGNWAGDGQSTFIFDWVASQLKSVSVFSLELFKQNIEGIEDKTKNVRFIEGDSVKSLNKLNHHMLSQIGLLYLDSFDWTPDLNMDSAFHHLMELASVWSSLPSGCMVVVDDRHDNLVGKHWLVEMFMKQMNIAPAFVNYQIGWIKT